MSKKPPVKDSLNGGTIDPDVFYRNTTEENLKGLGGYNNVERVKSSPSKIVRDNVRRTKNSRI